MPWFEILMRQALGGVMLGLAYLVWQGRFAPRLPDGGFAPGALTAGKMVAVVPALAATTAFGVQVGYVMWIQLAAIYAVLGYVIGIGLWSMYVGLRQIRNRR